MCLGGVDGRQLSVLAILTTQQLPSWHVVGLEVCVCGGYACWAVSDHDSHGLRLATQYYSVALGQRAASRSLGPEARAVPRVLSSGYGCARLFAATQRTPNVAPRLSRHMQETVVACRVLDDCLGPKRRSIASALTPFATQETKKVRVLRPLRLAHTRVASFALGRVGRPRHSPAFLVVR